MKSFGLVHSAVHAGVAGICWWVLHNIGHLQAQFAAYQDYAVPAALGALALMFRTSDKLANALVEKVPGMSKLLRRVLSGRAFIEGQWPLVVVDMAKHAAGQPALLYYGHLRIDYRDGQLHVAGDDWHPDGTHAHAFESVQSNYDAAEGLLQYWYRQGELGQMRGYTEIFFFPKGDNPVRHAGKFLDPSHTSDIRFYALRYPGGLWSRGLTSRDAKLTAAKALWANLEPSLDRLKAQNISADFA